jgi:uncharacterized repeat protein (TIGR01451 family)
MNKQNLYLAGLGIATVVLSLLPMGDKPAIAQLMENGTILVQNVLQQPKVSLNLVADKQFTQKDDRGKVTVSWKELDTKKLVLPGEVIRFRVLGKNQGNKSAKSLNITQRIPQGLIYQLKSATASIKDTTITYSIDQGKTFVASPMVKVTLANGKVEEHPAPDSAYTHVRWDFNQQLQPEASLQVAYLTRVR